MGYPDYYRVLEIPEVSTQEEIRQAYKKQALLNHPDRLGDNATEEERRAATRRFQLIADAYYVLGDEGRRREYHKSKDRYGEPSEANPTASARQANDVFGNIFEELLRPEVEHPSVAWRILGAGAGAVLGFIVGNVGGAAVGALAGKTLGQIRDHKGKLFYIFLYIMRIN
ncbi:DnaJ domain-containing protein [Cunninghamella echinulata]|nr:DnaJ domain-containing protein [Cunninghamella echinulata]